MSSLRLIPAGSTIEEVYFAVPTGPTIGPKFSSFVAAGRHALAKREASEVAIRDSYPKNWPDLFDHVEARTR